MRKDKFVFHDSWGGRWRKFKAAAIVTSVLLLVALVLFIRSLFLIPPLATTGLLDGLRSKTRATDRVHQAAPPSETDRILSNLRGKTGIPPVAANAQASKNEIPIRAAFFVGWDAAALASLREHQSLITHLCPEWLSFTDLAEGPVEDADAALDVLPREAPYKLIPVLSNLRGSERVPEAIESLALADGETKEKFVAQLASRLRRVGASGVVLDWQELEQGADHELSQLVTFIARGLRREGLETWLCISPDAAFVQWDFEQLAGQVDRFIALLHDENGETDPAGPIASQDWFDGWLEVIGRSGHAGKWIISLGTHGSDHAEGTKSGEEISFADAMSRAGNSGTARLRTGAPSFNGTFSYFYGGEAHEVWFLDAASFANEWNAVRDGGFGGVAINRMGLEDPLIWKILARNGRASADILGTEIPGGQAVTSIGQGEVVNLDPTSFAGRRSSSTDSSGRISCQYETPPAHPTLFRMGSDRKDLVCLSFDDGPDPEWTPAILDILKSRGAKAIFFIVGNQAEQYPDLVRRIAAEGHEIGNHSYSHANLAKLPASLIKLELNATQRLIESLTGVSTALFRPPYDADSRPTGLDELIPIRIAQSLGYTTVLENIDPRDWQEPTATDLLDRIKEARGSGSIILLHDGGGDRSATVEALPRILDYLQERGDRVVSLSELVSIDEKELMPPVPAAQNGVVFFTGGAGFGTIRFVQRLLYAFLVTTSVLVIIRTVLVVALACQHRKHTSAALSPSSPLSIIIPAWNEAKVIAQTVRSMLASDYTGPLEVLVVDDGSSDGTAAAVEALRDPRVRLIRQTNGGKSQALQHGVAEATADILVFSDADTQFDPAALRHLVEALRDEKTGAVSGQARVGNTRSFIARCQELEYLCSFNLDRRAYAVWNCITVVPGAISAIRREAIIAAGGFSHDTLAEDTDLTLAIHRAGYKVAYAPEAIAYTEAPETLRQLARQRFRWAFGTLQCVWKHRDMVFNPSVVSR
jgi:peptidoglycan/xylan/chitin deacetylase (PgdA/CDA1 family)/GT2 family glycosyltransferase/spore germination protein YaaH